MYYEEKFFNNGWWFRNEEYGAWYKFTYEMLVHKCHVQEKELKELRFRIDSIEK
jgi:hypothetical protein